MVETKPKRNKGMFKRMHWSAKQENDMVVLTLGNADIEMSYHLAFEIALALRMEAKQAKMWAGDVSQHWTIGAVLRSVADNYEKFIKPNMKYGTGLPKDRKLGGGS